MNLLHVKSKQKGGRAVRCPFCHAVLNSRGMPTHVRNIHPEEYPGFMANRGRYRDNPATQQGAAA